MTPVRILLLIAIFAFQPVQDRTASNDPKSITKSDASEISTYAAAAKKKKKKKKRRPQCNDKKDNDGDGLIDYPDDPGCTKKRDRRETDSGRKVGGGGESLLDVQIFPSDNPWNQDISNSAVDPNSDALIESIGLDTGLHPDFGTVYNGAPIGIPYITVSGDHPKVSVAFDYDDESDAGPYPIPDDPPIEGGEDSDGDRHILIVDTDNLILYELYYAFNTSHGWTAGSGAIFDLKTNELRPAGWTSADAAGLPILPGLARYDECVEKGEINHALRFTAQRTRRAYVYPARHYASSNTDPNVPPMGMRVRLKASFDISGYPQNVQVILTALKKYGMFLADNGSNWFITGAPDSRWDDDELSTLREVKGSDFEVVEMGEVVTE